MSKKIYLALLFLTVLSIMGCSHRSGPAPVVESRWQKPGIHGNIHRVSAGETLYAIAFRYDQDYRSLADRNGLYPPYTVRVGQILRLGPGSTRYKNQYRYPAKKIVPTTIRKSGEMPIQVLSTPSSGWIWPVSGRIISGFSPALGKKGIDIAGKKGDKIRAASSGVVAYAGAGLSGYGNLIIIKHNGPFLTAYANNAKNLVREGQHIKVGQVIAEMGIVDRRYWGLHFEIRKAGNPVNPLHYLQRR